MPATSLITKNSAHELLKAHPNVAKKKIEKPVIKTGRRPYVSDKGAQMSGPKMKPIR